MLLDLRSLWEPIRPDNDGSPGDDEDLNRKKEHELYLEREDLAIIRVLTEWLNRV